MGGDWERAEVRTALCALSMSASSIIAIARIDSHPLVGRPRPSSL
jgi:hypothetical protein